MAALDIYNPRLLAPTGGENFHGILDILWENPGPANVDITYEIEYTDFYDGDNTVWSTLRKRIPQHQTVYAWTVSKLVKSKTCRIRIRARTALTDETTDWSMSGADFSLNVFDLIAPAIISPLAKNKYNNVIIILLDESLTIDTYNQKVRYSLDYSSEALSIDWTTIVDNVPPGQSMIRWDISALSPAEDYVLRLTAKNSNTCTETEAPDSDQIARSYVYDIEIQPSGSFIIDTVPPQAVLNMSSKVTCDQEQTVSLFAEDATSGIKDVQLRECDGTIVKLGPTRTTPQETCATIESLLEASKGDFTNLIGTSVPYAPKLPWKLTDTSGLKRIEAIFTDYASNPTLDPSKVFLSLFDDDVVFTDFIIAEGTENDGQTVEIIYLSTDDGKLYQLDPLPKLAATLTNRSISKLLQYNDIVYVFAMGLVGEVYEYDTGTLTLLQSFDDDPYTSSQVGAVTEYNNNMYIGLLNGELWKFDGTLFSLLHSFTESVQALSADSAYLYIGFGSGENISTYDGTTFQDQPL